MERIELYENRKSLLREKLSGIKIPHASNSEFCEAYKDIGLWLHHSALQGRSPVTSKNMKKTIQIISEFAVKGGSEYLLQSTALNDFTYWADYYEKK